MLALRVIMAHRVSAAVYRTAPLDRSRVPIYSSSISADPASMYADSPCRALSNPVRSTDLETLTGVKMLISFSIPKVNPKAQAAANRTATSSFKKNSGTSEEETIGTSGIHARRSKQSQ